MTTPFEEGSPAAKLCFLAEAPAWNEMKEGRPLCGPSGQVFNDCLHSEGISRRDCYILNVWPFEVLKDKIGATEIFYEKFWVGRQPSKGEVLWTSKHGFTEYGLQTASATVDRLQRCEANVICTMGRQALELVTDRRLPIMKWRGSILEGSWNAGPRIGGGGYRKVIPTVHPAATLHGIYLWRYLIMADMRKAKRHSAFPQPDLPQRDIRIAPTFDDCIRYMRRLKRDRAPFATDLEVVNHQVHCFSLCPDPAECLVVPLVQQGGADYWNESQEQAIWTTYADIMEDPEIPKINQNLVGFDAPFLAQQNRILTRGPLYDTMIAQHIMYPDFKKGLDFICSIHTDEPYYKDEGKMWMDPDKGGGVEQFWRYNGKDACVALEAWRVLEEELTEGDYWPTYNRTVRMYEPLTYMTVRGCAVDRERLEQTKLEVQQAIVEKQLALDAACGQPLNVDSPKQCAKFFYETKGVKPYYSQEGRITTDDKALARIVRRDNLPEARLVQELRALHKLEGTYLEVVLDIDGRLRCSWNPRGTWTGRLSSSQTVFGTGLNLQNLHEQFLHFLVAD